MTRSVLPAIALLTLLVAAGRAGAADDILIADFEGQTYGDWKTTGDAFGPGPAHGTLPGQMPVSGYEGKGLVNSFYHGDRSTGTLTSPPLAIRRKYVNFLIGGGMHPGTTCINLLVGGHVVRTATGPNDRPGGSERLDWHSWDVAELIGQQAVIQIVDQETGGWGHINIDQIVQSDRPRGAEPAARDLVVEHRYLHLPVKTGGRKVKVRYLLQGQPVREFEIELADGPADFWATSDVFAWKGRKLTVAVDRLPYGSRGLAGIVHSDEIPQADSCYRERLRPQFHFSPRRGWTNDPNGLVYCQGEYHLFFQHNPYGVEWGNMTWGHAVSKDLLHWRELSDAIHPDRLGTIFSGSAVVDESNTAGFASGAEQPIVCIFTSAGQPFAQSLAYSTDLGRSFTKYPKNPVLPHVIGGNRDPKVSWYEPGKCWVMALFLDGSRYALFSSPDLKAWTRLGDVPEFGASECPDFFELPVDGRPQDTRWVFWGANGYYLLGRFDGKTFTKESGPHQARYGGNDYAAQTYSHVPAADGRRIQISWMAGGRYPGMPFNQQMTIPRVLTLRTAPEGIRLFIEPVREVETLRAGTVRRRDLKLAPGSNPLADVSGELLDIQVEIQPGASQQVGLEIRGAKIEYSPAQKRLTALGHAASLEPIQGRVALRILVDRTSIEVFANHGRVSMATCFLPDEKNRALRLYAVGGLAEIPLLEVSQLKSVWQDGQTLTSR